MVDGLAHAFHRERLADARFDELQDRRILKGHTAGFDANVRQRPANEVPHIGMRRRRRDEDKRAAADDQPKASTRAGDQNRCRFLTSSA
jgi:hypothetical protein